MRLRHWSRLAAFARRLFESPNVDSDSRDRRDSEFDWRRQQSALRGIRRELVELTAARARLEGQIARLRQRAQRSEERAYRALAAGREDQARFQLTRKRAALRQLELLAPQLEQLLVDERALYRREQRLALRIEATRQRRHAPLARKASRGIRLRLGSPAAERPALQALEPGLRTSAPEKNRRTA